MDLIDINLALKRNHTVVSSETTECVSLAEAKLYLGIATADTTWDALITDKIQGARKAIEGASNRTLIQRTIDYYQDGFGGLAYIQARHYPLISVTGVYTTDEDGDESTFSSDDYTLDVSHAPGRIYLNDNCTWPTDLRSFRSVRVRYVCGYTNADDDNIGGFQFREQIYQLLSLTYNLARNGIIIGPGEEFSSIMAWARSYEVIDILT